MGLIIEPPFSLLGNLYYTLAKKKMRSTIWVSGISVCVCVCVCERERNREREKKKKIEKGATKRKYALLTTDLRNAAANKKIIWAE